MLSQYLNFQVSNLGVMSRKCTYNPKDLPSHPPLPSPLLCHHQAFLASLTLGNELNDKGRSRTCSKTNRQEVAHDGKLSGGM